MSDIANRDDALKCAEIARAALAAGDRARAEKFTHKALRLYRCRQVRALARFTLLITLHLHGCARI
jgi:hypothetical protein